METTVTPGGIGRLGPLHFDATPSAQHYRRQRLQPDAIRSHLLDWKARDALGASFAAAGLIEMAEMLQTTTSEFTELVTRVMGILREVNAVPLPPIETWIAGYPIGTRHPDGIGDAP